MFIFGFFLGSFGFFHLLKKLTSRDIKQCSILWWRNFIFSILLGFITGTLFEVFAVIASKY